MRGIEFLASFEIWGDISLVGFKMEEPGWEMRGWGRYL